MNSKITFAEIIRNAPNIEILKICHNNWISKQTTWLEDLYKFKEGKNFRELLIYLNNIEFDIETLEKFVKTKSINQVFIRIRYENKEKQKAYHQFVDKMSKVFTENSRPDDGTYFSFNQNSCPEIPHINLEFWAIKDFKYFTLDMNKNDGPPLRKRQKRNK
uniref:Uncharacterized protein n=1 Tax=Panagrolaimus davidi TaxID=227884 RepID=A0A914NXU6_9BILA